MTSTELKNLTQRELRQFIPADFTFVKRPWKCQLVSFVLGCAHEGYGFFLDLGLGKSKVTIDLVRFIRQYYKPNIKVLVVCVNDAAMGNWAEQIKIHSDMKSVLLGGLLEEKVEKLESLDSGFYIIHYPAMRVLYADLVKDTRRDREGKKRRAVSRDRIRRYGNFDVVILDESHLVKNNSSLVFKIILQITKSNRLDGLYLLTGTPFGKSLLDIWSQYFLIDKGKTFGTFMTEYKRAYFEDKGFWGPDWRVTTEGEKKIKQKMFNKAIRYDEQEVKDLPEKVYVEQKFELSEEQRDYYDRLIDQLPVDVKGKAFQAKNKAMAFRQICSGFLMHNADGSETRGQNVKVFDENPKLNELLLPLIENVVYKSKVVIFHDFVLEGRMIEAALDKLKIRYASLRGEIKDKYEQYRRYRQDDMVRVLVAHPKSGGSSLEFVVGNYCVFYSNTYAVIDRKQCEKRVHRPGQVRRVFFYDLLGSGTIEESIFKGLQEQRDTFSRIVDNESFIKVLRGESGKLAINAPNKINAPKNRKCKGEEKN